EEEEEEEYNKNPNTPITIVATMSSVGIFRKVEMDDKPYFVYTLTQTNDNPISSNEPLAMDSSDPLQPLFFCPVARNKFHNQCLEKPLARNTARVLFLADRDDIDDNFHEYSSSPHFPPSTRRDDQQGESLIDCNLYGICKLPLVPFNLSIKEPDYRAFICRACDDERLTTSYYQCLQYQTSFTPLSFSSHPLTFFPTQSSLVCHFCGLINKFDPTYICIQCVFVIHKDCIGFPHVIRISRHPHRISFASSLPSGKLSCGVCRQQVDNNYGAYSCKKCDAYFVHSKCALHPKVWDGENLEGVPEEEDEIDDGEPFERIADGIILHPFHSHRLLLDIFEDYDEYDYCRGCILPIYEGQFYSCWDCDFILHESCANAPRMIRHPLHPRPLTLNAANEGPGNNIKKFCCSACNRKSTGFYYEHRIGDTSFLLDLRCATIIEPFIYQGHEHPLFLPWDLQKEKWCQMCQDKSVVSILNCMECDYTICFRCVTIPYKVRYNHDIHALIIYDGKEASGQPGWCEICEGSIKERKLSVYKCDECCTTLHVECLLGIDIYMKPIKYPIESSRPRLEHVWIFHNISLSRPICTRCLRRCPFPTYFRGLNRLC
ncbi:hypothetical protein CARUB_v10006335mg, partial [Capsella rubella]